MILVALHCKTVHPKRERWPAVPLISRVMTVGIRCIKPSSQHSTITMVSKDDLRNTYVNLAADLDTALLHGTSVYRYLHTSPSIREGVLPNCRGVSIPSFGATYLGFRQARLFQRHAHASLGNCQHRTLVQLQR